jgi:hypothetical protein
VDETKTCDAHIRLPKGTELICELEVPHRDHQAVLHDYAYPGSVTMINWHEVDRRNYHGDWPGHCDDQECSLPKGHPGGHAL